MKKIIITLAVLLFSTSVNARDLSMFSITAGIAGNQSIFAGKATETNENDSSAIVSTKNESAVFMDGYQSGFVELGIGPYISFGYEHTPDSISTPTNETRELVAKSTVSVDFNDLNTTYIKINLPRTGGAFIKAGTVETDLDIKEVMASGRTYNNVSTEGTMFGVGYAKQLGDSAFDIRIEGSYLDLDNVSTSNGVASGAATVANSGRNQIDTKYMEGLTGKIALTLTLGRN